MRFGKNRILVVDGEGRGVERGVVVMCKVFRDEGIIMCRRGLCFVGRWCFRMRVY